MILPFKINNTNSGFNIVCTNIIIVFQQKSKRLFQYLEFHKTNRLNSKGQYYITLIHATHFN